MMGRRWLRAVVPVALVVGLGAGWPLSRLTARDGDAAQAPAADGVRVPGTAVMPADVSVVNFTALAAQDAARQLALGPNAPIVGVVPPDGEHE